MHSVRGSSVRGSPERARGLNPHASTSQRAADATSTAQRVRGSSERPHATADNMADHDPGGVTQVEWLLRQVQRTFKEKITQDKFAAFATHDKTVGALAEFFEGTLSPALWFNETKGTISVSSQPPSVVKLAPGSGTGYFYAVKLEPRAVGQETFRDEVVVGELTQDALLNLSRTLEDVYLPLLSATASAHSWPDMVSTEVMESVNTFISNVQIVRGQV